MSPRIAWSAAIACAAAVAAACAAWIRENPLPSYFDEALYAIQANIDVWAARTHGLGGVRTAVLHVDTFRPPAMRLLALPVTLMASPSVTVLRAISLAGFFAAAAIAAIAVQRAAGAVAGAVAFTFTMALPILVLATRMFGTEYPLLLAIALLLLGLTSKRATAFIATAVALGLLAKLSFAIAALPMLIAAAIVMPDRRRAIAFGAPIGLAISLLWWAHDPTTAIRFGVQSGNFIRHSLGRDYARYIYELLRCDFGFAVAAAIAIAFVMARRQRFPPLAIVCVAGAVPLVVMHALSVNNNPRLVAVPALLVAIAAALVVPHLAAWQQALILALAALQVVVMTLPRPRHAESYIWRGVTEVMAPVEQWDWQPLRRFAFARGWPAPRIEILGEGYAFNPAQISDRWPELLGMLPIHQLYEWSFGKPFDLQRAIERAAAAQIVVTAPGYQGDARDGQPPNNRYNAAFAAALARDPRFEGPYALDVGVRQPAIVQVFVRRAP
ncbi:MAG TPA: hypothetical protein VI670_07240 [Thermoanaerobaculia bacterium]|jgi:hypothetical protein